MKSATISGEATAHVPEAELKKIQRSRAALSPAEQTLLADREKQKGNEEFVAGDFTQSVYYFTRSLAYAERPHLFTNRALAFLRLQKYEQALKDCDAALALDPYHFKALLRRGIANLRQHHLKEALADFQAASRIDPDNKELHQLLQEAKNKA